MERNRFEPYSFRTREELEGALTQLKLSIPLAADASVLAKRLSVGGRKLKNRLMVHPMEGFDGEENGAPGELTYRRYNRFASGGAALIWSEAISVCREGRSSRRQLMLTPDNLDSYKRLCDNIHKLSDGAVLIAQLTHSGRFSKPDGKPAPVIVHRNPLLDAKFGIPGDYPLVSDDELERIAEQFIKSARLAAEAGFDGIDVKACHHYLLGETLSGYERSGRYGGSFEGRTRLFREIFSEISRELPEGSLMASRLAPYDHLPYPYGFGASREDFTRFDPDEPVQLLRELRAMRLSLVDVTVGTPYLEPHVNRPNNRCEYIPPEHPLVGLDRLISCTAALKRETGDIVFAGAGYSYLREFAPLAAAGAVERGMADLAAFGRLAFAYPDFARDILSGGLVRERCCVTCGKCTEMMREGYPAGCPVRDSEVYLPILRKLKKYSR